MLVFGMLVLLAIDGAGADPLSQWTQRFPYFQTESLTAVTYGGGQFVAVGWNGTIISSPDGYVWTDRSSHVFPNLQGVAHADGQYAAVGDGGIILISSNAAAWTQVPSVTTNTLHGIAGNPSWRAEGVPQFLAVGDSGTAVVCSNSTAWSVAPSGTSSALNGVVKSGPSTYLIVGGAGTAMWLLPSGFDHRPQDSLGTTSDLYTVAADGKGTVTAGGELYSNPFAYTPSNTNEILYSTSAGLQWTNQQWLIDGNGNSPNLWYLSAFFVITGMACGSNGFVGVGYTGEALEYHPSVVMTSANGANWIELPSSISENALSGVTYGQDLYVAVGDFGSIVVSTNAVNWTEILPDRRSDIIAIACNTNLCIAAAMQSWYSWGFPDLRTLVSTNGVDWTVSKTVYELPELTDLACSESQFVGVAGTSIYTTTDGYNWQTNGAFATTFRGVRHANGQFFAVGDKGGIYASLDGTNWNNRSVPTTGTLSGLASGNGVYVAGGFGPCYLSGRRCLDLMSFKPSGYNHSYRLWPGTLCSNRVYLQSRYLSGGSDPYFERRYSLAGSIRRTESQGFYRHRV